MDNPGIERLKEILIENDWDRMEVESWEAQLRKAIIQNDLWNNIVLKEVWEMMRKEVEAINQELVTKEIIPETDRRVMIRYRNVLNRIIGFFSSAEKKIEIINAKIDENIKYLTQENGE
jgi:hypothetical protein